MFKGRDPVEVWGPALPEAVLEENIGGRGRQKVDDLFLVVALKTQAKTTKSTTPTLQKTPGVLTVCWFYYCILLL